MARTRYLTGLRGGPVPVPPRPEDLPAVREAKLADMEKKMKTRVATVDLKLRG